MQNSTKPGVSRLAHVRVLAGLRAGLIPTDAARIVSHLFLLAFSRLGGFTRLAHFCRLGALVALTVHGHWTKAIDYSSLAKRSRKADRWTSLAAVQSDPLETALAAALAAMTTFPSIAAPMV